MNGPSVAVSGSQVAVGWFTIDKDDGPLVRLSRSSDGGRTFEVPVILDDGDPIGRVAVTILPDGTSLACWFTRVQTGGELRVRSWTRSGLLGRTMTIASVEASRNSGFPSIGISEHGAVVAWTDAKENPTLVRTVLVNQDDVP